MSRLRILRQAILTAERAELMLVNDAPESDVDQSLAEAEHLIRMARKLPSATALPPKDSTDE